MKDLRKALNAGEILIGPGIISGYPSVIEIAGFIGFDWVFIDTEQAAPSGAGRELEHLVQAAYAADVAPTVRVSENQPSLINKALNLGAKAVWVPHVETAEEAAAAVAAAKYAPEGRRGAAPVVRAARHGLDDWDSYRAKANEETFLILIIESVKGIENVEEIAAVPGVEMICFGPFDLAVDMGLPQRDHYGDGLASWIHPDLEAYGRRCLEACRRNGVYPANLAWNKNSIQRWAEMGYQFMIFGTDITLVVNGLKDLKAQIEEVKTAVGTLPTPGSVGA